MKTALGVVVSMLALAFAAGCDKDEAPKPEEKVAEDKQGATEESAKDKAGAEEKAPAADEEEKKDEPAADEEEEDEGGW
jgi:hypothetical protein